MSAAYARRCLDDHLAAAERLRELLDEIAAAGALLVEALRAEHKVLWCGNGGSAADAQHLATELVCRFETERRGLPGIALTTDTSALTAIPNDYGYERVFARQVEALGRPGDVLVAISTSGESPSVLAAAAAARAAGMVVIGLAGRDGGALSAACDRCLVVPDRVTARIQECHILIGHIWCGMIDEAFSA